MEAKKVKKEKKKSKILDNHETLDLKEFMLLNAKEQNDKIKEI